MLNILRVLMGSDGCLVASAVFKTVEGSYAALVGSIPSLSAKEETLEVVKQVFVKYLVQEKVLF